MRVQDRYNLRRTAAHHVRCGDKNPRGHDFLSRNHAGHNLGGLITGAYESYSNARERRIGQTANHLIVIYSKDTYRIGHWQVRPTTSLQGLLGSVIVTGHQSTWKGDGAEPARQQLHFLIPGPRFVSGRGVDLAMPAGLLNPSHKRDSSA